MNAGGTALAPGDVTGDLTIRDVRGPAEMADCVRLYEHVMGLKEGDGSLNPRLLTALQHNSGLVIGAYLGTEIVGFTYSFLARERDAARGRELLYQYSQLAVVARDCQGAGIGRQLKAAQRERCLAEGTTLLRWAYDPLQARNAHFNLDVLGGVVDTLLPAMYGPAGFGDGTGEATDRFIVSWHLDRDPGPAPRPLRIPAPTRLTGAVHPDGDDVLVVVPDDWRHHRRLLGHEQAAADRDNLTKTFARLLADRSAVSCQRIGDGLAAYRFTPRTPANWQRPIPDRQPAP
ncbi:hypothetical protein ACFWV1_31800 [Streptomyces sp. NPDC058700]|uniref:hypothetical protein n=1 Tax=unclassified Streptomyces TaxID=2593676 RepID=UPI00365740E2